MEIVINTASLQASLSHITGVIERRSTIAVLANVLLQADGETLRLTGTDMDIDLRESVKCTVVRGGSATIHAATLADIVRKLPKGSEIKLTGEPAKQQVVVQSGRSRFTLPSLPVEDFPTTAGRVFEHTFDIPAETLRKMISSVAFAISTEETRYYLNGIYMHAQLQPSGPVLRGVSTDGHRLARVEFPLPEGAQGIPGVILPRKLVLELAKLIDGQTGPIRVELSQTAIQLTFSNVQITSKLIDGTFPDYERVIPTMNDKHLTVGKTALADIIDRVAVISSEKSRAVKIEISTGSLVASCRSSENGVSSDEIDAEFSGGQMEIGFNSRYMLDILKQIGGETVKVVLADAGSPTIFLDPSDPVPLYVLMPMRV